MPKPSAVPIKMPPRVMKGQDITAEWANSIREAVWRLTMRGGPDIPAPRARKAHNPFDVLLEAVPDTDPVEYQVLVQDGWVNERIPGVNDPVTNATAVHKPHNILWGADGASESPVKAATDRREFPITIDQQVSILVYVNAEGGIELPSGNTDPGPTSIVVETEDEKSIHYVPPRPVDSDVGIAGEYHYKLAVLRDADATHSAPWLEIFLAGSHLDHFRDLPILDNSAAAAANIGRPFFKYKKDINTYLFRSLDATAGQLEIEEIDTADDGAINIRGNSFDGEIEISVDGGSAQSLATVVDGLITEVNPVDIPLPDAFPGGLWGTFIWENYETNNFLELTFSNGALTGMTASASTGAGTEASPYAAGFESDSP